MIVIYTQEKTYFEKSIEQAKSILIELYGAKLGNEAYNTLSNAPVGTSYRKHGGPLVKVVDAEKAKWIREKEIEIGIIR